MPIYIAGSYWRRSWKRFEMRALVFMLGLLAAGGAAAGRDIVVRPQAISRVQPVYTEEASALGFQGIVFVPVRVGVDGKPVNVKIVNPIGMGMDQQTVLAALQWRFKPGTKNGKPEPMETVVEMEFHLAGLPFDRAKALARARYDLAVVFFEGKKLARDPEMAEALLERASGAGNVAAKVFLGDMLVRGKDVAPDVARGLALIEEAAASGYVGAKFELGLIYAKGLGVKKDVARAIPLYKEAARKGSADAAHDMGVLYEEGDGVEKDMKEAMKWYRRGAEEGRAESQFRLGKAYRDGEGVKTDKVEALFWFLVAADGGDDKSQDAADYLAGQMAQRDIQRASRMAQYWEPRR